MEDQRKSDQLKTDLDKVRSYLEQGYSVAAVKDGLLVSAREGTGIKPFLELVEEAGDRMRGAALADKIIGRTVAMACVDLGVESVYAGVISEAAEAELKRFGVPFEYGRKVPRILNRDRSGLCPTEVLVDEAASPEEALPAMKRFVDGMKKAINRG